MIQKENEKKKKTNIFLINQSRNKVSQYKSSQVSSMNISPNKSKNKSLFLLSHRCLKSNGDIVVNTTNDNDQTNTLNHINHKSLPNIYNIYNIVNKKVNDDKAVSNSDNVYLNRINMIYKQKYIKIKNMINQEYIDKINNNIFKKSDVLDVIKSKERLLVDRLKDKYNKEIVKKSKEKEKSIVKKSLLTMNFYISNKEKERNKNNNKDYLYSTTKSSYINIFSMPNKSKFHNAENKIYKVFIERYLNKNN